MPISSESKWYASRQVASLWPLPIVLVLLSNVVADMWPGPRTIVGPRSQVAAVIPPTPQEVAETLVSYQIRGATFSQLDDQIEYLGPKDASGKSWDAWTRWHVSWTYEFLSSADGCKATEIRVKTSAEIQMPEWLDQHSASIEMQQAWRSYYDHLYAHEKGHARIGEDTGRQVREAIAAAPPASTCHEFRNRVDAVAHQIVDTGANSDQAYDAKTRHGKAQGVARPVDVFPPSR